MKKLIFVCALGIFSAAEALACSCMPPGPPKEELKEADAVFVGKVVRLETEGDEFTGQLKATIRASKVWKGPVRRYVVVRTARQGSMCGYGFQTSQKYVVYTYKSEDGRLTTNICSRTKPLAQAAEDLEDLGPAYPPIPRG